MQRASREPVGSLKTTSGVPVRGGPHVEGEMRNVCSIRPVAGDGGLNTEVGLGLSIDHSVADPVRAALEVKDQEISLTHTHTET